MVRKMTNMQKQVKALWQRCFHDSEAFTDLYFEKRYHDERNLAIEQNGQITAALQLLPYPMTFYGTVLSMDYISGACTHPDYRNQGIMSLLLQEALEKMVQKGDAFTTLIPAEPWLFQYYARFGYAPVFRQSIAVYQSQSTRYALLPDEYVEPANLCLEEVSQWMETTYKKQYSCCILHPSQDLEMVYASLQLDQGVTYLLRRKGQIQAVAFATPSPKSTWHIDELLSTNKQVSLRLLQHICDIHQQSQLTLSVQAVNSHSSSESSLLGMARILQVPKVLQIYAQANPRLESYFHIHDEQIPANNGFYMLKEGRCQQLSQQPDNSYTHLTVKELTENLLNPLHPYMSLMLN